MPTVLELSGTVISDGREIQIIDGDCTFNDSAFEKFIKDVKLAECGLSYAVVSIMGPQCSGKSTLLNHVFHTDFKIMDGLERKQTTKGIWMAKCVGIEPCTLVLDLEGSDGRERGEDDTTFEKQSALFALAVSDIVLINIWAVDFGRVNAANMSLLKTVFQVMVKLFSPRKTTLMFVIRDAEASLESLKRDLLEDVKKIWDSVLKPPGLEKAALADFFNVEVTAISHYKYEKELFKKEVDDLRNRFFHSIAPGGLAGDRRGVVPASEFSFSTQQIWKVIKENQDLNLPALKVLVATLRCEEIASEKCCNFLENEEWREVEVAMQSHPVPRFGEKINAIVDSYLSEYDAEAAYFDECVRTEKRKQLEERLLQLVQPCCQLMAGHYEKKLKEALAGPVLAPLLDKANDETWQEIKELFKRETRTAAAELSSALSGFKMDEETKEKMLLKLEASAKEVVESRAKEEAGRVLQRMKDRFSVLILHDCDIWTGTEDIQGIIKTARSSSLKLLSVLAVVRLDDEKDGIENALSLALISSNKSLASSAELLASSTWEEIPPSRTLLTPIQCKSLWIQFLAETERAVFKALSVQEASKRNSSRIPPPWAIAAIAVLGFNEFMALLRNPLYLGIIFIGYLLLKALWVQLDVSNELRHGVLHGMISLSSKFVPTILNMLKRLAKEGGDQTELNPNQLDPTWAKQVVKQGI